MNLLQKIAWYHLAGTAVAIITAGAGVGLTVYFNAKGVIPLMAFIIGALIVGLVSCRRSIAIQTKLDERERKVAIKAFVISSYIFVLFLCFTSFTIFFLSGARSRIPGYTLPVLLLIGIFVSQLVQSAIILIQFTREKADEQ